LCMEGGDLIGCAWIGTALARRAWVPLGKCGLVIHILCARIFAP
jgi:hypothetical protein